jgi:hypothetical protein
MNCLEMDVPSLKGLIDDCEVDFKNSETRAVPKEYQLIFEEHEKLRSIRFALKDSSATILDIRSTKSCDCP